MPLTALNTNAPFEPAAPLGARGTHGAGTHVRPATMHGDTQGVPEFVGVPAQLATIGGCPAHPARPERPGVRTAWGGVSANNKDNPTPVRTPNAAPQTCVCARMATHTHTWSEQLCHRPCSWGARTHVGCASSAPARTLGAGGGDTRRAPRPRATALKPCEINRAHGCVRGRTRSCACAHTTHEWGWLARMFAPAWGQHT